MDAINVLHEVTQDPKAPQIRAQLGNAGIYHAEIPESVNRIFFLLTPGGRLFLKQVPPWVERVSCYAGLYREWTRACDAEEFPTLDAWLRADIEGRLRFTGEPGGMAQSDDDEGDEWKRGTSLA